MVAVDAFSKWTELIPMHIKESGEVAQAIYLYIIARFGCPQVIRCDRGTEFAGSLTAFCHKYGIRCVTISNRHP